MGNIPAAVETEDRTFKYEAVIIPAKYPEAVTEVKMLAPAFILVKLLAEVVESEESKEAPANILVNLEAEVQEIEDNMLAPAVKAWKLPVPPTAKAPAKYPFLKRRAEVPISVVLSVAVRAETLSNCHIKSPLAIKTFRKGWLVFLIINHGLYSRTSSYLSIHPNVQTH